MKKSIVALLAVFAMLTSLASGIVFADANADAMSYSEVIAKSVYGSTNGVGVDILENDKYIFVVEGEPVAAFTNKDVRLNDRIHIFEKPNSEHLDYKFMTTINKDSNNASRDVPARDVFLYDDVLYVMWGNAVYQKNTNAFYPLGTVAGVSYAEAYDVSELSQGTTPSSYIFATSCEQRILKHTPFIRGGIAYVDEAEGDIYISGVANATYNKKEYYRINTQDIKNRLLSGSGSVPRAEVEVVGNSMNTTQFVVKNGYLYEVQQQRAGLTDFDAAPVTLKDADGNPQNNTLCIYDAKNGYIDKGSTNASDVTIISDYKRGTYITATPGGATIKDIEVSGNYVYLATTNGLEVIDASAVKTASSNIPLELTVKLLEGEAVNGITLNGTELYVGTDTAMVIYDISEGVPSLINSIEYAGGFCDFEINENENMLYALSAAKKGGAVLVDLDILSGGLYVNDFEFSTEGKIEKGNFGFSAKVENKTSKEMNFKSLLAVSKGDKLVNLGISDFTVAAGEILPIEDAVEITADSDSARVIFIGDLENANIIPMITNNGFEFEKETGKVSYEGLDTAENIEIADMDKEGNVLFGGVMSEYKNKPLFVMAKNLDAAADDALDGYRYVDVITLDDDGKYGAGIRPTDSGEYEISIKKGIGGGSAVKTFDVPKMTVELQNSVEVPGIDSFMYAEFANGQNVTEFSMEITYDKDVVTFGEDVTVADVLEVSDVVSEEGKLTLKLKKKDDAVLTTDALEFCMLPISIKSGVAFGNYDIEITVNAKDELSNEILAECTNGVLEIVESTPKYTALEEAKKALSALKKATDIKVDDYLTEKAKIEEARKKVDEAYSYFLRDSQMGTDLIENLKAAEMKIDEIKPYYDAVDSLNDAEKENVYNQIKDNNEFFSVDEEAFEIFENLEDKTEIEKVLAETDFEKPSDVEKVFYKELVLIAFPNTNWQNVRQLLDLAEKTGEVDLEDYNKLTDKQKAVADKELDLTEYEDLEELSDAVSDAVAVAEKSTESSSSGSGSGSGSGSRGNSNKEYYVTPQVKPTQAPSVKPTEEPKEIFSDIKAYGWAKDAISYLYENNVINGKAESIFAPGDNVKREEFAKMISIAFDIKAEKGDRKFSDVSDNAWYSEYIYSLCSAGIINGRPDETFGVGDDITREEIAVILERVASYKGIEIAEGEKKAFADSENISDYAKEAIEKLCAAEIISGFEDNTVRPQECANRAQSAQLIYKLLMQ